MYKQKYLKYKSKYLNLKQLGGKRYIKCDNESDDKYEKSLECFVVENDDDLKNKRICTPRKINNINNFNFYKKNGDIYEYIDDKNIIDKNKSFYVCDPKIQFIPVRFEKGYINKDNKLVEIYDWDTLRKQFPKSLFIFNDNMSNFDNDTINKGSGNGAYRPWKLDGRAIGIPTKSNTHLNKIKVNIDNAFSQLYTLLKTGLYDTVFWSQDATNKNTRKLGFGTFSPLPEVIDYITLGIYNFSSLFGSTMNKDDYIVYLELKNDKTIPKHNININYELKPNIKKGYLKFLSENVS